MSAAKLQLEKIYDQVSDTLNKVLALAKKCQDPDAEALVVQRIEGLGSLALIVVVGDYNAGKSRFINALLGREICGVAVNILTSRVQEITYGETQGDPFIIKPLGNFHDKIYVEHDTLKEIAIVDTPGISSDNLEHKKITDDYLPKSDLILVVLSALSPETRSAWDLVRTIKQDWYRKIVFVVSRIDQVTQTEFEQVKKTIREKAHALNIQDPIVFSISSHREEQGSLDSGFFELRSYLTESIQKGEVWRTKLDSSLGNARSVITKLKGSTQQTLTTLNTQVQGIETIKSKLEGHKRVIGVEIDTMMQDISREIDYHNAQFYQRLQSELGMGSYLKKKLSLSINKSIKKLGDEYYELLKAGLENVLRDSSTTLVTKKKSMVEDIKSDIDKVARLSSDGLVVFSNLLKHLELVKSFDVDTVGGFRVAGLSVIGGGAGLAAGLAIDQIFAATALAFLGPIGLGAGFLAGLLGGVKLEINKQLKKVQQDLDKLKLAIMERIRRETEKVFEDIDALMMNELQSTQEKLQGSLHHQQQLSEEIEAVEQGIQTLATSL